MSYIDQFQPIYSTSSLSPSCVDSEDSGAGPSLWSSEAVAQQLDSDHVQEQRPLAEVRSMRWLGERTERGLIFGWMSRGEYTIIYRMGIVYIHTHIYMYAYRNVYSHMQII